MLRGQLREAFDLGTELEALSARVGHVSAHWCAGMARTYYHFMTAEDLATPAPATSEVLEATSLTI